MKDSSQKGRPNGAMTMTRSELEIPSPAEARKLFRSKRILNEKLFLNSGDFSSEIMDLNEKLLNEKPF